MLAGRSWQRAAKRNEVTESRPGLPKEKAQLKTESSGVPDEELRQDMEKAAMLKEGGEVPEAMFDQREDVYS